MKADLTYCGSAFNIEIYEAAKLDISSECHRHER
jgi:hypothetical protein